MYYYSAYNLGISSEIALPQLPPAASGGDVIIRFAARDPNAGPLPGMAHSFRVTPRLATLDYAALGTLTVRDGYSVSISLLPDANESQLPLYLTGVVMAIMLYQRGLLVLRASAVAIEDSAAVFMADHGGGKSSLAARLHQRGHTLLADNITAIDMRSAYPRVIPATPLLVLDASTAALLGLDTALLQQVHPFTPRYMAFVERGFATTPVPLRVLYSMQLRSNNAIRHLPPHAGLTEVTRHCYPFCLHQPASIDHLRQISRMVELVPICELAHGHDRFSGPELSMISEHIGSIAQL